MIKINANNKNDHDNDDMVLFMTLYHNSNIMHASDLCKHISGSRTYALCLRHNIWETKSYTALPDQESLTKAAKNLNLV